MFEEKEKNPISQNENVSSQTTPQTPVPPSQEPEDIFAEIDKGKNRPPSLEEKKGQPAPQKETMKDIFIEETNKRGIKKVLIFVLIIILFGLAYLGYMKFKYLEKKQGILPKKESQNQPANIPQSSEPGSTPSQKTVLDSDKDGLSDEEEKSLGTDPYDVDTDKDGLIDRVEIQVYKTDPLKADSDSDGYLDGQEIKFGYDPLNPRPGARLRDLQEEIKKIKEK